MEPEDRSRAVLEFCEMVVRGVTKERCASDPHRWNTAVNCTNSLLQNLKYLRKAARADWDKEGTNFTGALSAAHSMRVVPIDKDSKRWKRQVSHKCDVCGRTEQCCGMAFDLGGGNGFDQDSFLDARPAATKWNKFIDDYATECNEYPSDRDVAEEWDDGRRRHVATLHRSDLGRFYAGKTCLRKAKVSFVASTFLLETLYETWTLTEKERGKRGELDMNTVYTAHEAYRHIVEEHAARIRTITDAVGSERKWDVPEVPHDQSFWDVVDARRAQAAQDSKALDDLLRRRVKETLHNAPSGASSASARRRTPAEDENSSEEEDYDDRRRDDLKDFIVDDDEDISEEEAPWEEEELPRPSSARRASASRKRMRVVDDDSDDSDDGKPPRGPRTRGAAQRAKAGTSSQPPKARPPARPPAPTPPPRAAKGKPTRSSSKEEFVLVEPSENDYGDDDNVDDDDDDANGKRLAIAPPVKSAVAVARAMRRPTADGAPPWLPNRRGALENMKRLATRLMNESRYEDLALLQPGIITLHELIEFAEG